MSPSSGDAVPNSTWRVDCDRARRITGDEHIQNIREDVASWIGEGLDLTGRTRLYVDFFAPADTAASLMESLESRGFEYMFLGAEADPTFVHARKERIWNLPEIEVAAHQMIKLAEEHSAAFDSLLLVTPEEDDIS